MTGPAGAPSGPGDVVAEPGEETSPGRPRLPAVPAADRHRPPRLSGSGRALAAAGWAVVLVGALGAADRISHFAFSIPWMGLARWMLLSTLVHDLVVAPLITLAALGVGRLRPRALRAPVAVGLIVSASLVAVSSPRLRADGALPDNPSVLPGDAARDLLVVLAVVWAVTLGAGVVRLWRARGAAGDVSPDAGA